MQPLIVAAPRQMAEVKRLVEYCRRLDGTEVWVLPARERGEAYPHRNNSAFHQAALAMKGRAFIWLEPDASPLRKGWVKELAEAYRKSGKAMLISSDANPPHDMVGGIGVFGPETHWLIPERIHKGGFDGWMIDHIAPLVERSPIVQHSYWAYDANGCVREHRFPRDAFMLRSDAAIFHRDKHQDIIKGFFSTSRTLRFAHPGDIGDCIAALPVIRQMGGGRLLIRNHPETQTTKFYRPIQGEKYEAMRPLLAAQDYISGVEYDEKSQVDCDFTYFRGSYEPHKSLALAHARHAKLTKLSLSPWLKAKPDPAMAGRVTVSRSPRYHNDLFPWKAIAKRYGESLFFIGHDEEKSAFQEVIGRHIEGRAMRDFLEMAEIISGSRLFIGNQSAPCWVAMGLGHPIVQETSTWNPDSIIERKNALFVPDGKLDLDELP